MFSDGCGRPHTCVFHNCSACGLSETVFVPDGPVSPNSQAERHRHNDGINHAFCDGNVKRFKGDANKLRDYSLNKDYYKLDKVSAITWYRCRMARPVLSRAHRR
ncbi:MAG: hypothetical protein AB7W28_01760 [Armatimonadota bacterium]